MSASLYNYILNPKFDLPAATNVIADDCTEVRTASDAPTYTLSASPARGRAMRIEHTCVGVETGKTLDIRFDPAAKGTFAAGDRAIFSVYIAGHILTGSDFLDLYYYNSSDALISSTSSANLGLTGLTARTRFSVAGTCPAATSYIVALLSIHSIETGDTTDVYLDSPMLAKTSDLINWFDGDSTGCYWSGVHDASTSYKRSLQVVYDGDSNTLGAGSSGGNTYPRLCTEHLANVGVEMVGVNLGEGGDTWARMENRGEATDAYYGALNTDNILCCFAGTNDLYSAGTALDCIINMRTYIAARRAVGWKVIIGSTLPTTDPGASAGYEAKRNTVDAYIAANWPDFADGLADWHDNVYIGTGNFTTQPTYWFNASHINPTGLAIVAGIFEEQIMYLLSGIRLPLAGTTNLPTVLENLIASVNGELENHTAFGSWQAAGDGTTTSFTAAPLARYIVDDGTWAVEVGGAETTAFTMDFDSGVITFDIAPALSVPLTAKFNHVYWTEELVVQAVNAGINNLFPALYVARADTSIPLVADTYEYALPVETQFITAVETRSANTGAYTKMARSKYEWLSDGDHLNLRFFSAPTGFMRVRCINRPSPLVGPTDTLEDTAGLPGRAKDPIISYACWYLLTQKIAPRIRSDIAVNTQGVGTLSPRQIADGTQAWLMRYQLQIAANRMPPWMSR